jgi:hypothetical protein
MRISIKKPLLAAGVVSSVALASLTGAGLVSAATPSTSTDGPTSLIEKIATKFNLNKDEVKAVFEEERTAHQAERQKANEDRLSQAVTDGKITEDQKAKILAKQAELKSEREANRDSLKDKTEAERKAAREAKRTELEAWAKTNDVPTEYLRMGGHGGPGGPGGPRLNR